MATKTFKIGEYAKGGVITAIATKTKVKTDMKEAIEKTLLLL